MKRPTSRQYTIRNIPEQLDRVLRLRAKESGTSFNQVILEALIAGSGERLQKRDLAGIAGSMDQDEAEEIDAEIRFQRQVEAKLWA